MLISAVPREAWSGTQKLCFQDGKRRAGKYLDVKAVFPSRRSEDADEPELLSESAEEIVKLAVEKAKVQPVLFYGKSTMYSHLKDWPKDQRLTPVALSLSINAKKFFADLLVATRGFYFLEADNERDLGYCRGVDYRSNQPRGICLILACTFKTKSEYLQAKGRVKRGADAGQIWELQQQMFEEGT